MQTPTLYYVYDPMCSWCWGYKPVWQQLEQALDDSLPIKYSIGGLAPDSNIAMPLNMQQMLQQTWQRIATQLGTEFNFDFWRNNTPKRSTYPACRACIVARAYNKEHEMILAIQQAYYLNAQNPSNEDTLLHCAQQIGIDADEFTQRLNSDEVEHTLQKEIAFSRSLPIQGFPSLVLVKDRQATAIPIDYLHFEKTKAMILSYL